MRNILVSQNTNSQKYGQKNPHCTCQRAHLLGSSKCRNPRCSTDCYSNFAHKQAAIIDQQLSQLQKSVYEYDSMGRITCLVSFASPTIYRGSLHFAPDTTVDDVKKIKTRFLKLRQKSSAQFQFQLHCTQHCTAIDSMHYDFIAYSDDDPAVLMPQFRDLAKAAGFSRVSIVPLGDHEITPTAKYASKAIDQEKLKQSNHYLPEKNGLHISWHTGGFFRKSTAELWRDCRIDWFGLPAVEQYEAEQAAKAEAVERLRIDALLQAAYDRLPPMDSWQTSYSPTADTLPKIRLIKTPISHPLQAPLQAPFQADYQQNLAPAPLPLLSPLLAQFAQTATDILRFFFPLLPYDDSS